MSDTVIIINTVVAAVVAMFTGVMAYQTLKLNLRAKDAAVEVAAVKTALKNTTTVVTDQLTEIHTLVNSQMGDQKRLLAVTARAKAVISQELRPDSPETKMDLEAAERAEAELAAHEKKQSAVDKGNSKGYPPAH